MRSQNQYLLQSPFHAVIQPIPTTNTFQRFFFNFLSNHLRITIRITIETDVTRLCISCLDAEDEKEHPRHCQME